jgi:hypothetical protein
MAVNNQLNLGVNALPVDQGGTGNASATAYALLAGGATSTAPLQSLTGVGTLGQVLTSNGPGVLPSFQVGSGAGGLGAVIQSIVTTPVALTNNVNTDLTSLALPAGTYLLFGNSFIEFSSFQGGDAVTWVNNAPTSPPPAPDFSAVCDASNQLSCVGQNVPFHTVTYASPTTVYLGVRALSSGGGRTATGALYAIPYTVSIPGTNFWINVATNTQALANNQGYITNNGATLVTYTLPATAAQGTIIEIAGSSAGGWTITQNAGQSIVVGVNTSTVGAGGSVSSTQPSNQIKLLCTVANTTWVALSMQGILNIV